ncbi:MAG TPA: serine/threonine-protein kinase [Pirellulales bacterium]|jgi:serine/threonine protein kinase|nr:serine/threonine-protein kinase [Pirellulales bacterium]
MKTATHCPPTEDLRQLLTGSGSVEQQQACTRHLDACACCQAKLEALATDGTNLSQLVGELPAHEPLATSAYWPALHSLETSEQTPLGGTPAAAPQATKPSKPRGVSLDFLQPATDSAYLGRLAHFDVMRVLGQGGMGVVLEAFDSRLQRNVAIKVLDPNTAEDEIARQRFCREARAAASISHEHVVAVHQVEKSSENGLPYLVMQLIAGESLEQRLAREEKLPLREIVRIGMQTAHGLAAAHAHGLIHRDVKPGNILLEPPHDTVKLTDFGLARAAEDAKLTRTGFVTGTPLYMAPEQALGGEADPRSDLFSLGAILYELCAGQPPFTGNSALVILKKITDSKQRPVREVNPQIPTWLSDTIDHLLAKRPVDRIQTAQQVAELLEFQWALLKTTSDELPTVCEIAAQQRTRRNRLIATAVAATFLAVGLAVGWFLANRNPARSNSGSAALVSAAEPEAVLSANAGPVWSAVFSPDSQTLAMAVEDGAVRFWDLPKRSIERTVSAHRGTVWMARYSPGGKILATAGDDGLIKLWRPPETEPERVFKQTNAVRAFAFSHDAQTIYAADREGGLRVWSLAADQPAAAAQAPGAVYALALSPDDEMLATGGSDKVVQLWNAKTLTPKFSLDGHAGQVYALAFSPDGKFLASAGWDGTIRIWETAGGQLHKSWVGCEGDLWSVAYSPDGKRLATGGSDGIVKLWNSATGEPVAAYLGHKGAVHTVAFNRDGSHLASGGRDGNVRVWKLP